MYLKCIYLLNYWILKRILKVCDWGGGAWTGLIGLRIVTGGELLWMRWRTFEFLKNTVNFLTSCGPVTVSFSRRCFFHGICYCLTLILPRSRTGTVWFYSSTSNKRAARPKLYTKSLTMDLKLMYNRFTLVRISINLNSSQLNMFRQHRGVCITPQAVTQSSAPEDG